MPYRRTRRTKRTRRPPRRRRTNRRKFAIMKRPTRNKPGTVTLGFGSPADRAFVKLKWCTGINHSASLAYYTKFYRGNGPQDPDVTGGSTSPYGWDQYSALYENYICHGSKIKVRTRSNNTQNIIMCLDPKDNSSTSDGSFVSTAGEKYCKKRLIPTSSSGYRTVFGHYMSTQKYYGLSDASRYSDVYSAQTSGLPTNQWYWMISLDELDAPGAGTIDATSYIEITYYIEFFDPVALDRS